MDHSFLQMTEVVTVLPDVLETYLKIHKKEALSHLLYKYVSEVWKTKWLNISSMQYPHSFSSPEILMLINNSNMPKPYLVTFDALVITCIDSYTAICCCTWFSTHDFQENIHTGLNGKNGWLLNILWNSLMSVPLMVWLPTIQACW